MRHTFGTQARCIAIALATVVASAALWTGTTLAGPSAGTPSFSKVTFTLESGTGNSEKTETGAGDLTCNWTETGLNPFQQISYACNAKVVGALQACVYQNKVVANSPTLLSVFDDPLAVLGGDLGEAGAWIYAVSNKSGQINGSGTTSVPVGPGSEHGALCAQPAVAQVVAARWCSVSLTDTVNNLVGGTAGELFQEFYSTGQSIPDCATLATMPPTPTP